MKWKMRLAGLLIALGVTFGSYAGAQTIVTNATVGEQLQILKATFYQQIGGLTAQEKAEVRKVLEELLAACK